MQPDCVLKGRSIPLRRSRVPGRPHRRVECLDLRPFHADSRHLQIGDMWLVTSVHGVHFQSYLLQTRLSRVCWAAVTNVR